MKGCSKCKNKTCTCDMKNTKYAKGGKTPMKPTTYAKGGKTPLPGMKKPKSSCK
jgi:hypothetical protein